MSKFVQNRFSGISPVHDVKNNHVIVNSIIEIPKGSIQKYEWDYEFNMYVLDRTLPSTLPYPMSYGMIPNTLADDGDNLDVCVYATEPINRDTIVRLKIVTALNMIDDGEIDYKLIGVLESNPNIDKYNEYTDLDQVVLEHTKNFFSLYKTRTNKKVEIKDWLSSSQCNDIIRESSAKYLKAATKYR